VSDQEDPMYTSRTVPELLRAIQHLLTTARHAGLSLTSKVRTGAPPPGQEPGFRQGPETGGIYASKDHAMLAREAQRLHDEMRRHSQGSPGLRRLRDHPEAEAIRQSVLADNAGARRDAEARISREKNTMMTDAAATTEAPAGNGGKKKAAKKKVAKKAKKAAAKKTAKKAAGGERAARTTYDMSKTFTWTGGENPRRKGSAAYDRLEMLRRNSGKTLEKIVSLGGRVATVSNAVKMKVGKVA
jgi:membrane protein involved in colicin uptake